MEFMKRAPVHKLFVNRNFLHFQCLVFEAFLCGFNVEADPVHSAGVLALVRMNGREMDLGVRHVGSHVTHPWDHVTLWRLSFDARHVLWQQDKCRFIWATNLSCRPKPFVDRLNLGDCFAIGVGSNARLRLVELSHRGEGSTWAQILDTSHVRVQSLVEWYFF